MEVVKILDQVENLVKGDIKANLKDFNTVIFLNLHSGNLKVF